jgi:apocytochrome f
LNQKAVEIEAPQAVLPNSVFEVEIKVPYDVTKQQIGANGKPADLNVGGILILPNGFKLAPKNQIPEEVKVKNKGVFISPYSTEFDNILVVGPIAGKTHPELIFPVVAPDPEKSSDVKYLTYPFYAGGNRGRGQVYPTGEKSNVNIFGATQDGQITNITTSEKGESSILIINSKSEQTSQTIPAGLMLIVKNGDIVKTDQALNSDPNVGGFGQEESEIVLQNPIRIVGYLAFCFFVLLTQISLVLKKKQFEKVQAAELNF